MKVAAVWERLGREIDSLRQELFVARKIEDEKALMEYRIKLFGDIIRDPIQAFDHQPSKPA